MENQERRILHLKDQLRIRNLIGKISNKYQSQLIKSKKEELGKTPSFKKHRTREMAHGAAIGGIPAALTGAILRGRKGALAGLAGGAIGAAAGYGKSRQALTRRSKSVINKQLRDLLTREMAKTYKAHAYLSQPGKQTAQIKRPWGQEQYSG